MTKEELRERILELEDRMSKEDSREAVSKMYDEWGELSNNLEDILYEELEGMALKVITEKITERYDIDTDILVSEYMESGIQKRHLLQQPRNVIAVGKKILKRKL